MNFQSVTVRGVYTASLRQHMFTFRQNLEFLLVISFPNFLVHYEQFDVSFYIFVIEFFPDKLHKTIYTLCLV